MKDHIGNQEGITPNDSNLHKQIKDVSDILRPELQRLYKSSQESSSNILLYISFIENIKAVKIDVTSQDAFLAFQNIICHMQKAIELSQKNSKNQEVLWHLQEVMALAFKVQNLPR